MVVIGPNFITLPENCEVSRRKEPKNIGETFFPSLPDQLDGFRFDLIDSGAAGWILGQLIFEALED